MSEAPPVVSAICAWFNRSEVLDETLDSLLGQREAPPFEVIVVNDGSRDPKVREILDARAAQDPRLKAIHQANAGFVHAIRAAADAAQGRYLAVMGAGDVSHPLRFARQAAALDADPGLLAAGCWYEDRAPDGAGGWRTVAAHRNAAPAGPADLHVRNPYAHGEVMMRREAYQAVGGYRTFFKNSQDADLWLRLIERGRLGQVEEALYERRIFADGISGDVDKMLRQSFYSSMAIAMSKTRLKGEEDLVDRYGEEARWMRPRTTRSARRFLIAAAVHRHRGDIARSDQMLGLCARENPLYAVGVAGLRLALAAPKATGLPALGMTVLRKVSPAVNRFIAAGG
ncbi:glycosyltransferase family 2 protein [Albimonas pacifica]|uniref:Glycosyl transferase family 2 n=1 Tax=Albimonas pacifica TaxID=1114924 RepID=A0A1I3PRN9_9RHOB|nr:glycosyltransferase family A protein [Albimonas pacifica]SFJ24159.1 Glycosyl transferase family 2 [Albimonas pacifica]